MENTSYLKLYFSLFTRLEAKFFRCKFLNFSSSMHFVFIPLFGVSYKEKIFQSEKTNKYKSCNLNGLSPTCKILEVFYGKLDITAVCEVEC